MNEPDTGWMLKLIEANDRRYEERFAAMEKAVDIAHATVRDNRSDWVSIIALVVSIITAAITFLLFKEGIK